MSFLIYRSSLPSFSELCWAFAIVLLFAMYAMSAEPMGAVQDTSAAGTSVVSSSTLRLPSGGWQRHQSNISGTQLSESVSLVASEA